MIDTAVGVAVIGGRMAAKAASVGFAPARFGLRVTGLDRQLRRAADTTAEIGRIARQDVVREIEHRAVRFLESAEVARLIDEVTPTLVERLLATNADAKVVDHLVRSGTVVALVDHLVESGTITGIVDYLVSSGAISMIVSYGASAPEVEEALREAVSAERVEAIAEEFIASDQLEQWLKRILASPRLEAAIFAILDSDLVLSTTDRLTESDEMRKLLNAVATSPEIRTALAEQSMGMAGEITTGVRRRSVTLDDAAERTVRRILRRPVEGS